MHKLVWITLTAVTLAACNKKEAAPAGEKPDDRTVLRLTVGAVGYEPAELHAPAGKPARLVVTRTSDDECGKELAIPSLDVKRELPLNQPVSIDFTMPASGTLAFACGMDMMKGTIIAD